MKKKKRMKIAIEDLERQVELNDQEQNEVNLVNTIYELITTGKHPPNSSLYHEEYIKELIHHVGIKGKSYTSLAFKLGCSVDTLYDWEKKFPKWKEAKKMAFNGRLGFLEDLLTNLADGTTKGNAAAAIFYAKNAAPDEFKDKRELEHTGGVTYVIDTGIPVKELENVENEFRPRELSHPIDAEFTEIESEKESEEDLL